MSRMFPLLMNARHVLRLSWLFLAAGLLTLAGCQQDSQAQKEKFIKDMLAAFGKQKSDILERAQGVYEDVRVYRDGKNDVIVFERKLAKDYEAVDPGLKSDVVKDIKSSEPSMKALKLGIQFRMVDKSNDGKTVSDFTITKDDL